MFASILNCNKLTTRLSTLKSNFLITIIYNFAFYFHNLFYWLDFNGFA